MGWEKDWETGKHTECRESMVCFESWEEVPLDNRFRKRRRMRDVVGHPIAGQ